METPPDQPPSARFLVERRQGDAAFCVIVEPEGWSFDLAEGERYIFEFYGTRAMDFAVSHCVGGLEIWRPADSDVWAVKPDGTRLRIGMWPEVPFPWLDSNSPHQDDPPFSSW
jgi:hypothetical protein